MRRSAISRRTKRSEVPRRSAACSTVNIVSNSDGLPACEGSCSSGGLGRGGQFLPGDPSLFASAGGGRQGKPPLALGLVASANEHPGGNEDHGLVLLGPAPGIQRYAVTGPAALGEGDPGPPQGGEGGRVAAALGRPVPTEAQHVRPGPQPQPVQ